IDERRKNRSLTGAKKLRPLASAQALIILDAQRWFKPRLLAGTQDLIEVNQSFDRFELAEEKTAHAILAPPVRQQMFGYCCRVLIVRIAPPLHILAQRVNQRQIVAFLFGKQLALHTAGELCLVPIARGSPTRSACGFASVCLINPMLGRLSKWATKNRLVYRLNWNFG